MSKDIAMACAMSVVFAFAACVGFWAMANAQRIDDLEAELIVLRKSHINVVVDLKYKAEQSTLTAWGMKWKQVEDHWSNCCGHFDDQAKRLDKIEERIGKVKQ